VFSGLLTPVLCLYVVILRFYTPTSGRISLDGVWMGALDKRFLTNQIALVGQVSGHTALRTLRMDRPVLLIFVFWITELLCLCLTVHSS
jgi:hypothetical protein